MPVGGYIPRRTGLSVKESVKPLLSNFRNRWDEIEQYAVKITEPDDPAAPPLDSSSDDAETVSRRGDIRPSTFQTNQGTGGGRKPTTSNVRKSTRNVPARLQSPKRSYDSNDDDEIEEPAKKPAKKAKIAAQKKDGDLGSQFTDALRRKAVGPKKSYTAQKNTGYGKSTKAAPKPSSDTDDPTTPENPKSAFKAISLTDDDYSPEKQKAGFIPQNLKDSAPTPSPKKVYKAPFKSLADLENTPSPVKVFKPAPDTDDNVFGSSPEKATTKPTTSKPSNPRDELMKRARLQRQKKKEGKEEENRLKKEMEDTKPQAVFMLPDLDSQDDLIYDPDIDCDILDEPSLEVKPVDDISQYDPVCPMCGEAVDQEQLDIFSKNRSMSIKQQQRFCDHHKSASARQTWQARGYPEIDWTTLSARIVKHHAFLEDILNGGASHFGTLFAKSVRSGKNKTLLKTDRTVTPGYYGGRGSRAMTDYLIERFSALLRKVAVRDRLVSARGHTGFVQFVLVPELAVRLIMEDMGVSAKQARAIMEESQKIGDMLNEDEDDVIVEEDDENEDYVNVEEDGEEGEDQRRRSESTSSLSTLPEDDLSVDDSDDDLSADGLGWPA